MVSDNVARARVLINRYPEVFESLLEFERTKKIPKLYRRKRLNITIDENILKAAGIIPGEKVEVLNVNNGSRIETYAIAGKAGSGHICLNGPAARKGMIGDTIIIIAYGIINFEEAEKFRPFLIYPDSNNRVTQ